MSGLRPPLNSQLLNGHIGAQSFKAHSWRRFSSSPSGNGHYQTLSVPINATKNQIKSSYYKLSKLYHPDVAKGPQAKERFQAVSEAYAVLGDDRKRRAYDRSLATPTHHPHGTAHSSPYSSQWSYETRRRGATYAWDHPRRRDYERPPPGFSQHPAGGAYHRSHTHHPDPFSSPHVQRATGWKTAAPHGRTSDADRVNMESGFWRTMQVIGVVMVIAAIGGGFSASAV